MSGRIQRYFVTGTDTDVGKTIISALLVEALGADYWKPVQSGTADGTDTQRVAALISNSKSKLHPERYAFKEPVSPHYAAELESAYIDMANIRPPKTDNHLIVEGAGGLMVPLNNENLILDLIQHLALEVIVVSKNYLGSINHTLSTLSLLKNASIPIKGIIFNGPENIVSQDYITAYADVPCLAVIPEFTLTKAEVLKKASIVRKALDF